MSSLRCPNCKSFKVEQTEVDEYSHQWVDHYTTRTCKSCRYTQTVCNNSSGDRRKYHAFTDW